MAPPQTTTISLTVAQAATLTGVSEWTIRDEINRGRIEARRNGRRILIDHTALMRWFHSLPLVADGPAS